MRLSKSIIAFLTGSCLALAMAVGALISLRPTESTTFAMPAQGYSCASVHFGMKDADHTAMTYDCSTSSADLAGYYIADGVSIESIECANIYAGGAYTTADKTYSQYAVRVGKSKNVGSITITLNKEIVGCTIYALQYASDPVVVCVNGQETSLSNHAESLIKANATALTYDAYSFKFDVTDTLVVKSKQGSKTVDGKAVSASRFYLADIALRVA